MSVVLDEVAGEPCEHIIEEAGRLCMSAATLSECLIVANGRGVGASMATLLMGLDIEIVSVTESTGRQVAAAYARYGKGMHPARLNFGDCFAYVLARERNWPLLYVGNDFGLTDVVSALPVEPD